MYLLKELIYQLYSSYTLVPFSLNNPFDLIPRALSTLKGIILPYFPFNAHDISKCYSASKLLEIVQVFLIF